MALLDIFKRKKKEVRKSKVEAKPQQLKPRKPVTRKKPVVKKKPAPKEGKKSGGRAYQILKTPHVTEKATSLTSKNHYVFKVWPRANKVEVKKAVEDIFGVDVVSVKIVNVTEKRRRLGRVEGFRSGYKKAIVRLKEGQKIEILPR
jgi:large subunit ribosomal protein L23